METVNKDKLLNTCIPLGLPYQFKNLKIYPLLMKDYTIFEDNINILLIEKNYIGDIDIIKMSYLRFLLTLGIQDEKVLDKLLLILRSVLHLDETSYTGKIVFDDDLSVHFMIDGESDIVITESDFEAIKTIILYQNIEGYDDKYVDPDIKKAHEEYLKLKYQTDYSISLEKKIAAFMIGTQYTLEEIYQMPIRTFNLAFSLMNEKIDYQIAKQAELQGTNFKNPIEHWLFRPEKDKYSEGFVDYDNFKKHITSV